MAAYRLQDLTAERIQDLRPDYILEYFEGKDFVDGENLERDDAWLSNQRRRYGPNWHPIRIWYHSVATQQRRHPDRCTLRRH